MRLGLPDIPTGESRQANVRATLKVTISTRLSTTFHTQGTGQLSCPLLVYCAIPCVFPHSTHIFVNSPLFIIMGEGVIPWLGIKL